jgi:mannose/fructose/N-acetylgalactosamine-specific phosphotransferase system component IID
MKKSFDSGTDVEDAKEALESNKEFFNTSYKTLIKEAKDIADEKVRTQKK